MDRRRPDRRPAGGPHRRPGLSSRFDAGPEETKLVVPLFDKPLVRHVAEAALASRARPILVVTGHATAQVEAVLKNRGLFFLCNPDYRSGPASSLKAGIAALPETAAGALILLSDMPCVSVSLIDRLIEAFGVSARTPLAVVPVRAGLRGNPALIGRDLFDAIKRLEGDRGARALLEAAGNDVHECLVDDDAIEIDIDTNEAPFARRAAARAGGPVAVGSQICVQALSTLISRGKLGCRLKA